MAGELAIKEIPANSTYLCNGLSGVVQVCECFSLGGVTLGGPSILRDECREADSLILLSTPRHAVA